MATCATFRSMTTTGRISLDYSGNPPSPSCEYIHMPGSEYALLTQHLAGMESFNYATAGALYSFFLVTVLTLYLVSLHSQTIVNAVRRL